jgi:hypothetical protein
MLFAAQDHVFVAVFCFMMWSLEFRISLRYLTPDTELGFVIYFLCFHPLAGEHVNLLVASTPNIAGARILDMLKH